MSGHKTPQRQAHARLPAGGSYDTDQQAVEQHHPDRADARGDSERVRHDGNAEIVGENLAGSQWLDGHNGIRPHFVLLDAPDHARSQKMSRERRIIDAEQATGNRGTEKNQESRKGIRKSLAENHGISIAIEGQDVAAFGLAAHVDNVVGAAEQLVQVMGKVCAGGIFANTGEVRGNLPI